MKIRRSDATQPAYRFALYWSPPPDSALARLGAAWLGRDAVAGSSVERPAMIGFDADRLTGLTAGPRHYGLHGTLKPPFVLIDDYQAEDLEIALDTFTNQMESFTLPPLQLSVLDGFLALVPSAPSSALNYLAAHCVVKFDHFRRPAGSAELARRRTAGLTPRQEEHLSRWGYPYVLDCFRFHVTLTDRLKAQEAEQLLPSLSAYFAPVIGKPVAIDEITLFVQPAEEAAFDECRRFRLRGSQPG
jgi:putative phosphonate metabolism protein